jgi:hypothetical protein
MNHAEAIYKTIPTHIKRQFESNIALVVSRLIETIEENPFGLSRQEKAFMKALGNATKDGKYGAVYEAFGKVLSYA